VEKEYKEKGIRRNILSQNIRTDKGTRSNILT